MARANQWEPTPRFRLKAVSDWDHGYTTTLRAYAGDQPCYMKLQQLWVCYGALHGRTHEWRDVEIVGAEEPDHEDA